MVERPYPPFRKEWGFFYFFSFFMHTPILAHLAGVGQPAQGLNLACLLALLVAVREPRFGMSRIISYLSLRSVKPNRAL